MKLPPVDFKNKKKKKKKATGSECFLTHSRRSAASPERRTYPSLPGFYSSAMPPAA